MSQQLSRTLFSVFVAIGGGVAALMGLCYGSGMLLDPHMEVETERSLEADPEAIAALITSTEGAVRWWNAAGELHGQNRISERITIRSEGDRIEFLNGEQVFEVWTLREADERSAVWEVDFGTMVATRTLTVEPAGNGAKMTWHEAAEVGSPVMRWMARLPQENVLANFHGAMDIAEAAANAPPEPIDAEDPPVEVDAMGEEAPTGAEAAADGG